jgi:hypothetical protein
MVQSMVPGPSQWGPGVPVRRPHHRSRVPTVAVACAIGASAVALFLALSGPRQVAGSPTDEPAQALRIVCSDGSVTVERNVVAVRPDGLHAFVTNKTDARLLYMRDPRVISRSTAFELEPRSTVRHVIPMIESGTWVAGCFAASGAFTHNTPLGEYSAPFEVVEP